MKQTRTIESIRVAVLPPKVDGDDPDKTLGTLALGVTTWASFRLAEQFGMQVQMPAGRSNQNSPAEPHERPTPAQRFEQVFAPRPELTHCLAGRMQSRPEGGFHLQWRVVDTATEEEHSLPPVEFAGESGPEELAASLYAAVESITGCEAAEVALSGADWDLDDIATLELVLMGEGLMVWYMLGQGDAEAAIDLMLEALRRAPQSRDVECAIQSAAFGIDRDSPSALIMLVGKLREAVVISPESDCLKALLGVISWDLRGNLALEDLRVILPPLLDYIASQPAGKLARFVYPIMAELYERTNRRDIARQTRRDWALYFPADPDALFAVAEDLLSQGRFEGAEALLRRSLAADPDHIRSILGLTLILNDRGDREGEARLLRRAAELAPEKTYIRSQLAVALTKIGALDEADALLTRLVEEEPENPDHLLALARVRRLNGDLKAVDWCLERVSHLRCNPEQLDFMRRERLWQEAPRAAEILESFRGRPPAEDPAGRRAELADAEELEQAVAWVVNPLPSEVWAAIGMVRLRNGDPEGGLAALRRAVAVNPGHTGPRRLLTEALAERGDLDEAVVHARKLVGDPDELSEEDSGFRRLLILLNILFAMGRDAEAAELVGRVLHKFPYIESFEKLRDSMLKDGFMYVYNRKPAPSSPVP
jgi:tetratricopeptide (TPR) repeat protein